MVNLLEEPVVWRDFPIYLAIEYLFSLQAFCRTGVLLMTLWHVGYKIRNLGLQEKKHLAQGFATDMAPSSCL